MWLFIRLKKLGMLMTSCAMPIYLSRRAFKLVGAFVGYWLEFLEPFQLEGEDREE
jgi:hypothetical protein